MEVLIENILYGFIEGQTHHGIPRGAKISVDLNESHEIGCSSFKFKHYLLNQVVCVCVCVYIV